MKKIFYLLLLCMFVFSCSAFADVDFEAVNNDINIQNRIDNIGFKLLNANKVDKRMVFLYDKREKNKKSLSGLTKRQIVLYKNAINFASDDNEIAAIIAPEISMVAGSYSGAFKGFLSSIQMKCAAKKYEVMFDKRAVDYMVTAGYNPVALITYINKAYPQKRYDVISAHNLTSKRLANIYEYIYFQYPQFLAENEYLHNDAYQNFLLTSIDNRRKLQQKVRNASKERIKYE